MFAFIINFCAAPDEAVMSPSGAMERGEERREGAGPVLDGGLPRAAVKFVSALQRHHHKFGGGAAED